MSNPFEDFLKKGSTFVDPDLVDATIKVESSGNPDAVSSKGAQGLMQLTPTTAKMVGVTDPKDPKQNKGGGTRYLAYLLDKFKDKGEEAERYALAAYNRGETWMHTHTLADLPTETKGHGDKIEREKEKLKSRPDAPNALAVRNPPKTNQSTPASKPSVEPFDGWLNSGGMGVPDYTVSQEGPFHEWHKSEFKNPVESAKEVVTGVAKGAASNVESLARGAVAAVPGVVGDTEGVVRQGINAVGHAVQKTGVGRQKLKDIIPEKTVLPTTEQVRGMLPDRITEARPESAGMEEMGSDLNLPGMEIGLKAPGQVLRFVKPALGEALDQYHTALGGKSHILAPPTASEKTRFASLKSAGATPEEIWRAIQMVQDNDGHIFTRVDDSKAKWKGEEALRAKVPKRAEAYDQAEADLKAKIAEKPNVAVDTPEYKAWKDKVEELAYERDKAKGLFYSASSTNGLTMKDVLHHPELYKRHPELKDIKVQIGPRTEMKGAYGEHDFPNNRIRLSDQTWQSQIAGTLKPDHATGTIIHELQHAVDRRRIDAGEVNMDVGANPDEIYDERNKAAKAAKKPLSQAEDETLHSELALNIRQEMEKGMTHEEAIKKLARQLRIPATDPALVEPARRAKIYSLQELDMAHEAAQADWNKWYDRAQNTTEAEAYKLYQADPGEVRARSATEGLRIKNADAPFPMSTGEKGAFDLPQSDWVKRDKTLTADPNKINKPRPALNAPEPPPIPLSEALGKEGTTLKTLERLPMNRGVLTKKIVWEALQRDGIPEAEKDIIRYTLLTHKGDTIPAADLVEQFKAQTKDFELTPHHHHEYADYGLENIGRQEGLNMYDDNLQHLINSRNQNIQALEREGHSTDEAIRMVDSEIRDQTAAISEVKKNHPHSNERTTTWQVGDGVSGSTGNHFSDPRYFAHTRAFEEDGIPHVVEMQSDLMQRGGTPLSAEERKSLQESKDNLGSQLVTIHGFLRKGPRNTNDDYLRLIEDIKKLNPDIDLRLGISIRNNSDHLAEASGLPPVSKDPYEALDHVLKSLNSKDKDTRIGAAYTLDHALGSYEDSIRVLRSEHDAKLRRAGPAKDLTPMKKTHVERLVKEELNMAAKNGQEKVRFAAPDTVAKVEGWSRKDTEIKDKIDFYQQLVNQDTENLKDPNLRMDSVTGRVAIQNKLNRNQKLLNDYKSQLDELGVKIFNPEHQGIYDNYKEIEKYLKNIGGTEYTDKYGHKWIEVKAKGEKSPVKEGRVPLFSMAGSPAIAGGGAAGYNANNSGKGDK